MRKNICMYFLIGSMFFLSGCVQNEVNADTGEVDSDTKDLKITVYEEAVEIPGLDQAFEMIFDVVDSSMKPMLNPALTASWEKGLTQVAEGQITGEEYMQKLDDFVQRIGEPEDQAGGQARGDIKRQRRSGFGQTQAFAFAGAKYLLHLGGCEEVIHLQTGIRAVGQYKPMIEQDGHTKRRRKRGDVVGKVLQRLVRVRDPFSGGVRHDVQIAPCITAAHGDHQQYDDGGHQQRNEDAQPVDAVQLFSHTVSPAIRR